MPYTDLHLGPSTVLERYRKEGPTQEYEGWELSHGESHVQIDSALMSWNIRTYVTVDMIRSGHLAASVSRVVKAANGRENVLQERTCPPTQPIYVRDWLEDDVRAVQRERYGKLLTDSSHREAWNSAMVILVACDLVRDLRQLRWDH